MIDLDASGAVELDEAELEAARARARQLVDELMARTEPADADAPLAEITELLTAPVIPRAASPAEALADLARMLETGGAGEPAVTPPPLPSMVDTVRPGEGPSRAEAAAAIGALDELTPAPSMIDTQEGPTMGSEVEASSTKTTDEQLPDIALVHRPPIAPPPKPVVRGVAVVTPRVSAPPPQPTPAIEIQAEEPPGPEPERPRILPPPLPPGDDSPFAVDDKGDLGQAVELASSLPTRTPTASPAFTLDDEDTPFGDAPGGEIPSGISPASLPRALTPADSITPFVEGLGHDVELTPEATSQPPPEPTPFVPSTVDPGSDESSSVTDVEDADDVLPTLPPGIARLAQSPTPAPTPPPLPPPLPPPVAARPPMPHRAALGADDLENTDLARLADVVSGLDDEFTPPPISPPRKRPPTEIEITVDDDDDDDPSPVRRPTRR